VRSGVSPGCVRASGAKGCVQRPGPKCRYVAATIAHRGPVGLGRGTQAMATGAPVRKATLADAPRLAQALALASRTTRSLPGCSLTGSDAAVSCRLRGVPPAQAGLSPRRGLDDRRRGRGRGLAAAARAMAAVPLPAAGAAASPGPVPWPADRLGVGWAQSRGGAAFPRSIPLVPVHPGRPASTTSTARNAASPCTRRYGW
jgi:hypothetical protein